MRKSVIFWLLIALTVVTIALGLGWWLSARQDTAQKIAEQSVPSLTGPSQSRAPDFTLTGLDGTPVHLSDLRGKVVLLNFWASWCVPCRAEMPDLNALQRAYGGARDLVVVGVNFEEDMAAIKAFVDEQKLDFAIALDRDGRVTTQLFGVRPLPTTFIIDREGFIRDVWNGQIAPEAMVARLQRVW